MAYALGRYRNRLKEQVCFVILRESSSGRKPVEVEAFSGLPVRFRRQLFRNEAASAAQSIEGWDFEEEQSLD
jgi:hypothetical protein